MTIFCFLRYNTLIISAKNHATVDLFDIFIFNDAKSELKVILYLSSKVVSEIKVLSL